MSKIEEMINDILSVEGGYVNHPSDKGGETNFGITVSVARENGYKGPMKDMPRQTAFDILLSIYVVRPNFKGIFDINNKIGAEIIDTGVNCGPSVPSFWIQQCLNAMNDQGALYPDLVVDGKIGNATLSALSKYLVTRGPKAESVMLKALNCLQGSFYLQITEKRPKNEDFTFGWFDRRVALPS